MNFDKLTECLDAILEKEQVPGIDCIVYRNHEMIYRHFAGKSDLENNKEMNGNELYLIFSMTKMLTCTAALQLLERGRYLLDDPISMYLPEFAKMKLSNEEFDPGNPGKAASNSAADEKDVKYAKNPITVRHLFSMTGGLDYDRGDKSIRSALEAGKVSTKDLACAMAGKSLSFEPGTRYRYSLCHDVLGALIEVWSGKSLGEYMKEHLFAPLGMKNTFFDVPKDEERLGRMAARYNKVKGQVSRVPLVCEFNLSPEYESGGAGLTSSAEDYALFLDALACGGVGKNGNRILSSAAVELMGTNQLAEKALEDFDRCYRPGYGYGLGVRVHMNKMKSGSLSPIGEFGWDGAAGAFSMVDPKNNLSMVYFQHMVGWSLRIQAEMRNALYACLD